MKLKRLTALGISLALTLAMTVLPAHALDFPDVPEDFWGGKGYDAIHRMYEEGLALGYEDGTFRPNSTMSAIEALLFCARVTKLDTATLDAIQADHGAEVAAILPTADNMNVWAAREMAMAVEAGVLSAAELTGLSQVDPTSSRGYTYLRESISRETIAMYLVRAMQLEPLARSLDNYSLDYKYSDASDISQGLLPYVYVLTNYGVVEGTELGTFNPKGSVTRAEMTIMLCRALDVMAEYGITVELSEYTDYPWVAGTISATATAATGDTIVTLVDPLTDTAQSYTLPTTVKIYKDNMLSGPSALRNGQYARLNLNEKGTAVESVRLGGILAESNTYEGSVSSLEGNKLALLADGVTRTFTIDRFTAVQAGQETGDRSVIDYAAGYTGATCSVDETGHLAAVKFTGGTQLVEGLVEGVTANTADNTTTLSVVSYSGVVSQYTVPAGIIVTVNGMPGELTTNHVGKAVGVRVNVDTGAVTTLMVDSVSRYIQGPIARLSRVGSANAVVISDRFTGKDVTYPVDPEAALTYNGESKTYSQLESNWYATALIQANEAGNDLIVRLDAFPAETTAEGTLGEITYGSTTVLPVTRSDGSVVELKLEVTALPTITRNGKTAAITDLRKGDTVVLSYRYNKLVKIEATAQAANLTGTITAFSSTTAGASITVDFADGSSKTYAIATGTSVSQNGVLVADSSAALNQPGATVELVTDGDDVLSVNITAAAVSNDQITGTIYTLSTAAGNRRMTLLVEGSATPVTVNLSGVNTVVNLSDQGRTMFLSGLSQGDTVTVYGSYSNATFIATAIVKQ